MHPGLDVNPKALFPLLSRKRQESIDKDVIETLWIVGARIVFGFQNCELVEEESIVDAHFVLFYREEENCLTVSAHALFLVLMLKDNNESAPLHDMGKNKIPSAV